MFNFDEIHYVSNNSTHHFKVPQEVGPFNVKYMESHKIIEEMLESLNCLDSFPWKYDSKGVLSSRRRVVRLETYVCESYPMLDNIDNLNN